MRLHLLAALVVSGATLACGGDDMAVGDAGCPGPRALEGRTDLPADVDTVLADNCRMCHSDPPASFAPMPLVTWENAQAPRATQPDEPVYAAIGCRIDDERFPMPPKAAPSASDAERAAWPVLDDDERAVLHAWVAECAPPGP